ncbi:MAG: DnaJ domain-containing protein [bacterium]
MPIKNYYEIFKLYPPIDLGHLQDVYKQLIFEFHPDRNPERQDWAIEKTMEIVEGYNVLSDPLKRENYNFRIKNEVRKEPGEMFGVKRGLLKIMKSKEETAAEERFLKGVNFYADKDDWAQAQHEWVQAVKLVPGFVNAHFNLGILAGCQGNFKDAVACLERVIKQNPADYDAKKVLSTLMSFVYGKKV